jgi:hypothetical protein
MRRLPRRNSATGTGANSAPLRRTERPVPKNRFFTQSAFWVVCVKRHRAARTHAKRDSISETYAPLSPCGQAKNMSNVSVGPTRLGYTTNTTGLDRERLAGSSGWKAEIDLYSRNRGPIYMRETGERKGYTCFCISYENLSRQPITSRVFTRAAATHGVMRDRCRRAKRSQRTQV